MSKELLTTLMNVMIFVPMIGVPLILAMKKESAKYVAFAVSLIPFVLSIILLVQYLANSANADANTGMVFFSSYKWITLPGYDINYTTGMDGLSIHLIWLTTLIFPISIYFSWSSIDKYEKPYYALLLTLQVGVLGFFLSLDMLLFYLFFEMVLIPMYFIIGIWGGKDRVYASLKFFLYTLIGSLLMLVAIIYVGIHADKTLAFTTDYYKILAHSFPSDVQTWLFLAFAVSFAVKVPLFPFHTWLPDAHVQAPTAGSVILAAVLLKMGTYGLIRFCLPLFPEAAHEWSTFFSVLSVIGIIYGAMAAMVQTDVKKLVAYSSVSHMGFVVLGIFSFTKEGMSGAVIQMISHGVATGALFLIVGMIYDRRHTREIKDFQGLAKQMPIFTLLFMITVFASVGLPGLNGFVGEFLIIMGAGSSLVIHKAFAFFAATGVIIAAVYLLWMFRRMMFGTLDKKENQQLTDLNGREIALMMPLIILMFWMGLAPNPFLKEINYSSDRVVEHVLEQNGIISKPLQAPTINTPTMPQAPMNPVNVNVGGGH